MRVLIFIFLILFSFSVNAEYRMFGVAGEYSILYNSETGEVWYCGNKACQRIAIEIEDISSELKDKGFAHKPSSNEIE